MKNKKRKIKDKKEIFLYIMLSFVITYFIVFVNVILDVHKNILRNIDVNIFHSILFILIVFGISYLIIEKMIFKVYKWALNKLLKRYKIKIKLLFKPFFICGGIVSVLSILFIFILHYYILKNSQELSYESYSALSSSAQLILPNFALLINYLVIIGIFGILLYQLYTLNKLKVPFVRSLSAVILSMIGLLYLSDILVAILDFSHVHGKIMFIAYIVIFLFIGRLIIEYIDKRVK